MKRCPTCNRVENDDSLAFCRTDGTALVSESLPLSGEAGTSSLQSAATEIETSILPHSAEANMSRLTGPTTVLPSVDVPSATRELTKSKRSWVAIAFLVLVAATISGSAYL
jgi:hypothetical protein